MAWCHQAQAITWAIVDPDLRYHMASLGHRELIPILIFQALPLPRQHQLLKLVIGRLEDKSSQVRRYAVQLLTAMLRSNPFAGKVSRFVKFDLC